MIDAASIKDRLDCRLVVEAELGEPKKRFGNNWMWPCPFHDERTPGAFRVWEIGYKCYSCGASGDVITWAMQRNQIGFSEAVAMLGGDPGKELSPAERAEQAARRAEDAARRAEEAARKTERALEEMREMRMWEKYHNNLTERSRKIWESRGISEDFQNFWQLGCCDDWALWKQESGRWVDWWHSPTLTIPVWGAGWEVNNIKHRLLSTPPNGTKYIQERRGPKASAFVCNPDLVGSGPVVVVEGEIKAGVTFQALDDPDMQVVGLPGVTPDDKIYEQIANYDPVYLCLDPDAKLRHGGRPSPLQIAIRAIGKDRVLAIDLPGKIDDMIIENGLGKQWLLSVMRNARRVI